MNQPPQIKPQSQVQGIHISRPGLYLFLVYLVFYGVFVGLSAFFPDVMKKEFMLGLNIAVVYGITLIVLALILAVAYLYLDHSVGDARNAASKQAANQPAPGGQALTKGADMSQEGRK